MPALKKTTFTGKITYIGAVPERDGSLRAQAVDSSMLEFEGLKGEVRHGGATRASCVRVKTQYPRGTQIRNTRQLSVLSAEEIAEVAAEIGLDVLTPDLLGASLVIAGIPDFTRIPPSSRLQFASGATLVVDMENRPCQLPAREIEQDHTGHGKAFKAAALGKRGITAWVERPGAIAIGDGVVLHIPDQPVWAHLDVARAT